MWGIFKYYTMILCIPFRSKLIASPAHKLLTDTTYFDAQNDETISTQIQWYNALNSQIHLPSGCTHSFRKIWLWQFQHSGIPCRGTPIFREKASADTASRLSAKQASSPWLGVASHLTAISLVNGDSGTLAHDLYRDNTAYSTNSTLPSDTLSQFLRS